MHNRSDLNAIGREDRSKVFKEGRTKTTIMYLRNNVIKTSFHNWVRFNKTKISSTIVDDKICITVDHK